MLGSHDDIHRNRPSTGNVTLNDPMWHDANTLVNRLKSRFALAYGLDWKSPQAAWPIQNQLDTHSQPLVDQSKVIRTLNVQLRSELPQ